MKTTPSTISLEVPKRRIAADLVGMMRHLGRAAAQGSLLENWPGAVQELFAAAATISIQRSEGELAWQLVLTGIGEALTELANDQPPTLINESDTKNIIERVENDATDLVIPVDFLDHPWSLSPVALAKQTLLMWLTPNDSTDFHQDLTNLCHRFDSALILGLHRTIRKDEARYQQLLALRDDPTRSAWQMLEDWRLYRAQLIADFRTSPVFDESFALDQIYVPLNAWRWIKYDAETKDERKEIRAVSPLNADMLAWLRGEREKGRLRLISGGPGSGKSSAMKALAAELATNGNDGHPTDVLLFPLQRFQWRMGIVESVAATLNTYSNQLRHNPIDADHLEQRDRPLLLIFDGLDELTANTEVSEAISATFLRALDTVFHFWEGRPVWAIVTGRDAIFGNIEGPTTNLPGERFHLLPYHVRNHEHGAPDRRDYHDPGSLLAEDNRRDAFYRYTRAKGESTDQLPNAYSNDDLHDVTSQPLLNYFILTSGPDEIEDSNLARIYRRLFDRLHERNRNVVSRSNGAGKPGAGLTQGEFDRVFEALAVAAWRTGGTRAASWDEVLTEMYREDSYLQTAESRLQDLFESQMQDRGAQKPFRLAAAFFMRNQQATGVEFTHKSFGDYLYARRLAKALAQMADELCLTNAVEREMLSRWEALTADQRMSNEVARFLELEIAATVDCETLHKRHDALAPVVERLFREGFHAKIETSGRRTEQRNSQMEEALFIAWHAMWRSTEGRNYWSLGKHTGDSLYRALARQASAHGPYHSFLFKLNWSGVNLSHAELFAANLRLANLVDANLEGAMLSDANLSQASLLRAKLCGTDLEDGILDGANLEHADLRSSFLLDASLRGANLTGAALKDSVLVRANLMHAQLVGANVADGNLREANLSNANLTDAVLEGANLRNANLQGANLTGASFNGANLKGVRFRGANLEDAVLTHARGLPSRFRDRTE